MSTKDISIDRSQSHNEHRFFIDTDVDPELVFLLRKVGFRATYASWHTKLENDDTTYLKWARDHGYILVCHDKHRDAETKHSFYSEMYYRGGWVIRVGKSGQSTLRILGCILAQRHRWKHYFSKDSGVAVVHPSGCNFTDAKKLLELSSYNMRIPFDDPGIPLKQRKPLNKKSQPNLPKHIDPNQSHFLDSVKRPQ